MPEIIPFPGKKPEEPKKDITEGEVSKDGRILAWKSNATIDPSSDLIESELKKHEKMKKVSEVGATQKSSNIEPKKAENFYVKPSIHTRTRQELIKSERKKTRRVHRNIKSNEAERYEAVFGR